MQVLTDSWSSGGHRYFVQTEALPNETPEQHAQRHDDAVEAEKLIHPPG